MSDASFASLGPTLLARKGGAKPAMRPQWGPMPDSIADEQLEDLGWNDMGDGDVDASSAQNAGAQIVSITGVALHEANDDHVSAAAGESALVKAKPAKPSRSKRNSNTAAPRAAFTLRLDTERHLKLRLAATMQGISAQSLVTEALDAMLAGIADLDSIAARMKRN